MPICHQYYNVSFLTPQEQETQENQEYNTSGKERNTKTTSNFHRIWYGGEKDRYFPIRFFQHH